LSGNERDQGVAAGSKYQRHKILCSAAGTSLMLSLLGAMALWGSGPLAHWIGRMTANPWLVVLVYCGALGVMAAIVQAPLTYYSGFILEHRHLLSRQTLSQWLWMQVKAGGLGAALGLGMMEALYFLMRHFPRGWWFLAAVLWIVLALFIARVALRRLLPLFVTVRPLSDQALSERLRDLARQGRVHAGRVEEVGLGRLTRKANAAVIGWGKGRRILISDTLLAQFTPHEIEQVFAHELGHHHYHHVWKGLGMSAVVTFAGFLASYLIVAVSANADVADVRYMPALLLIMGGVALICDPILKAASRIMERHCDEYALTLTRQPEVFAGMMRKLGVLNLSDPNPPRWMEVLFYDHPPLSKRVAMAIRNHKA
jgi:STE24 endopeptidase